jgi:hypothetical protein
MPSRRRFLLCALVAATIGSVGAAAAVAPDAAQQFVLALGNQALTTLRTPGLSLEQREASFRVLLRQNFDVDFIGRFVLGRAWNELGAEQRADYLQVFGEFVLKTYSQRLGGYSGETFAGCGGLNERSDDQRRRDAREPRRRSPAGRAASDRYQRAVCQGSVVRESERAAQPGASADPAADRGERRCAGP